MSDLQFILEELEYEPRSYSGRGMYGKSCLGVSVGPDQQSQSDGQLLSEIVTYFFDYYSPADPQSRLEEILKAFQNTCSDSLGLGTIYYWPSIPFED